MGEANIPHRPAHSEPPDKPGVYALIPRLPHLGAICAGGSSSLHAHRNAVEALQRLQRAMLARSFGGCLAEERKAGQLAHRIKLSGTPLIEELPGTGLEGETFEQLYGLLRTLLPLLPPLYIGLAEDQSLQERLHQHQRGILKDEGKNTFGARARALGFAWTDFHAVWLAADNLAELKSLRVLEKLLHAIIHPPLSER